MKMKAAKVVVAVAVALVAVGCSLRKKEKETPQSLRITTTSLSTAYEGVSYSYTVRATGGNSNNYVWSISGQPLWLSIDPATGKISGTPPAGSAATYTFTVEVTDGVRTARKQFDLTVKAARLKADFEANPTHGTPPLTVNFTDKSTGNPTSWEWDFDNDGTVDSTAQNPTHTYNNLGWYTVKLTVSDGTSSDTCVKKMYILVVMNNVYYVDGANGDDANGGTGWSDAFATIGKALSVAGDYDVVLVADATYNETDLNFNGKKIYLKGVDHNTAGARPVIDCQHAGRAFYFGSGETKDSVVDNFTIQNGEVIQTYGGAIACVNNSSPTITNCVFQDNEAVDTNGRYNEEQGGAIYCGGGSASISNCTFIGNEATVYGGAISCRNGSSASITNCTFSSNMSHNDGGAIDCDYSNVRIVNCTFSGNRASRGGAILCGDSSSPTISNCIFSGNIAGDWGGGGAIFCWNGSPTVTNCTFSGNSANDGGGAISCWSSSNPTLNNCILWNNSAAAGGSQIHIYHSTSSCTLNYCCVDNAGYGFASGVSHTTIDDSNNCIFVDPQFVDAANGDYHLKDTSPCIDRGNNSLVPSGVTSDLDGNPRIVDGDSDGSAVVDIGAYEYQP